MSAVKNGYELSIILGGMSEGTSEYECMHTCIDLRAISVKLFIFEADRRLAWTTSFSADSNSCLGMTNWERGGMGELTEMLAIRTGPGRATITSPSWLKQSETFHMFVCVDRSVRQTNVIAQSEGHAGHRYRSLDPHDMGCTLPAGAAARGHPLFL